jgi:phosphoglycerate dehydrogenase-like enzyme
MANAKPVALMDPAPRTADLIFRTEDLRGLSGLVELRPGDGHAPAPAEVDAILPEAMFVIGQTPLPRERLDKAPKLRAVFNVEGNFLPNVDYEECFRRGIHVLSTSPVFAQPVAEIGLGLALDLARRITDEHMAFRSGKERYGLEGNRDVLLLRGQAVGIIGFGMLGRALRALLEPFRCQLRVFDPWLSPRVVRESGCVPSTLEELLSGSRVVFVTASVTSDNANFLGADQFRMMPRDGLLILLSRAGVVDFDAMIASAASGHIRVATDVFPDEPLPAGHKARSAPNVLLSAHRAGALDSAFKEMGSLVLNDVGLVIRGLPPLSCQRAERETVGRMRSKPVTRS